MEFLAIFIISLAISLLSLSIVTKVLFDESIISMIKEVFFKEDKDLA